MSEFKVGDKVRVLKNESWAMSDVSGDYFKEGDISTIKDIDCDSINLSVKYGGWLNKSEIEKVTYTNVKQPKIKGVWTSATTSRVGLLILAAMLLVSLFLGGLQSITSSIFAVFTFIALVNDEMCRYEFKERTRYRKDIK